MLPWMAYLSIIFIWGSSYYAIVLALKSFNPFSLLALKFVIASSVALLIGKIRKEPAPLAKDWKRMFFIGVLMLGFTNILTNLAVSLMPSGIVAVMMSLTPFWIVIITLQKTRPSFSCCLGLFLGAIGVYLLVRPNILGKTNIIGFTVMLLAPILWAIGTIFQKQFRQSNSTFTVLGLEIAFASIPALILVPFSGDVLVGALNVRSVFALLYLSLGSSLFAYAAYFYLIRVWSPKKAGTFSYLTPVVAVLLGANFLNESMNLLQMCGVLIVFIALILVRN